LILFAIFMCLCYNIVNWGVIAMFGYIKTYKPEMKIREFDAYKAVYCSLCKRLRKEYGFFARFTLNFDYTFLAMIRMSVCNSTIDVAKGRCPFNPFAKCNHICCQDDSLSFSSAVAMLMVYYKLKDTCHDEGLFRKLGAYLLLPLAARWRKKAAKRYPEVNGIISDFCLEQEQLEKTATTSLDRCCHPTAQALSQIFSFGVREDEKKLALQALGYNVGKWVYLIDALDDWYDDQKKGRFNPLIQRLGESVTWKDVTEFTLCQLNVCIDEACFAFDKLTLKNFRPIIMNILTFGLPEIQNEIQRKEHKK